MAPADFGLLLIVFVLGMAWSEIRLTRSRKEVWKALASTWQSLASTWMDIANAWKNST